MPTFYRPANKRQELAAVVWNPRANAALADFSLGNKFETSDPYVIQELTRLGYPTVEGYEASLAPPPPSPPPHELKPQPVKKAVTQAKSSPPAKKGPSKLKKRSPAPQPPESMDTEDVSPS